MKEVLLVAFMLGGGLQQADAGEVLEDVVWLLPATAEAFYPPVTIGEEYRGRLEFECRIRDDEGHVDCEVTQIDPDDPVAKYGTAFVEQTVQVDMEKTPGAAVGKRVRLTVTFS